MNVIKKEYRVKSDQDFQRVFHEGNSVANRQLVLYVYQKNNQEHFRVGLSVGKKIGNAVLRNQIKRYLRQSLLELKPWIKKDIDFILIARPDIKIKNMIQIKKSMIHVMNLANIIDMEGLSNSNDD